jgi:hypothetical protein
MVALLCVWFGDSRRRDTPRERATDSKIRVAEGNTQVIGRLESGGPLAA